MQTAQTHPSHTHAPAQSSAGCCSAENMQGVSKSAASCGRAKHMCYAGADGRNPYSVTKIVKHDRTADRLRCTCKWVFMHRVQPCCT